MACTQDEIKNFPWTPDRLSAMLDLAVQYNNTHATLSEAINSLSADTGIKREILLDGLTRKPKGIPKEVTQDMWERQNDRRAIEHEIRNMLAQQGQSIAATTFKKIIGAPRQLAVAGHFMVFPKTHLGDFLLTDPKIYFRTFGRSFRLMTPEGRALHAQRMLQMMGDTEWYSLARRAQLDVQPGGGMRGIFRGATKEILGQRLMTKGLPLSSMAFDELRLARFDIFKDWVQHLSPEERTPENAKAIANVINNRTGTTGLRTTVMRNLSRLLFAPRLLPAQFRAAYVDPIRSIGTFANRAAATPGELIAARYVTRKLASLAKGYTAVLAAEAGYAWVTGDKKNMPDFLHPTRSDWLRPRLFGYGIPLSPTVELWKLPFQMLAIGATARKGESRVGQATMAGTRYLLGRINPGLSLLGEITFGQLAGTRRPLPIGLLPRPHLRPLPTEATKTAPQVGWVEYLGTRMPIPLASFSKELYDEMREQGLSHLDAKTWIETGVTGLVGGVTGYHFGVVHEPPPVKIPKRPKPLGRGYRTGPGGY